MQRDGSEGDYYYVDMPGSCAAIPVFDDSDPEAYWTADSPLASTKVAGSGTRIEVKSETSKKGEILLRITGGTAAE